MLHRVVLRRKRALASNLTFPILSQVDLRDDAEKRKDAQQKLLRKRDEAFGAAEEVQLVSDKIRPRLSLF